jgi:hypothetical protein
MAYPRALMTCQSRTSPEATDVAFQGVDLQLRGWVGSIRPLKVTGSAKPARRMIRRTARGVAVGVTPGVATRHAPL